MDIFGLFEFNNNGASHFSSYQQEQVDNGRNN
jgi:hypothetical protein